MPEPIGPLNQQVAQPRAPGTLSRSPAAGAASLRPVRRSRGGRPRPGRQPAPAGRGVPRTGPIRSGVNALPASPVAPGRARLGKDHPDFAHSLNGLALLDESLANFSQAEPPSTGPELAGRRSANSIRHCADPARACAAAQRPGPRNRGHGQRRTGPGHSPTCPGRGPCGFRGQPESTGPPGVLARPASGSAAQG